MLAVDAELRVGGVGGPLLVESLAKAFWILSSRFRKALRRDWPRTEEICREASANVSLLRGRYMLMSRYICLMSRWLGLINSPGNAF
jgi:hypothetical protein